MQLRPRARRALLVVHVVVCAAWLGLTLGLLALGVTGLVSPAAPTAAGAYLGMRVLADWLLVPVSLLALLSGLALALWTPWGLARYHWVYVKWWLTLAATAASGLALRPNIDHAAAAAASAAAAGRAVPRDYDLVAAPSVALAGYTFLTVISVLKPWGKTARGRRLGRVRRGGAPAREVRTADTARTARTARTPRAAGAPGTARTADTAGAVPVAAAPARARRTDGTERGAV
ncbi:DUF2269 domain-containing protein [Streptomyces sp. B1866]|uniref:DUF2269 domain-containing protein n=1 Tax=Streptomyces sp. B1866 TaxID=3075431 RepID=UPI0028907681|nr:DUF2269 domain-containing protein [Streptomyces sp. B1866]MDT3396286.1 DUF2269 domain-containing protein [Streptomyces sp. B1866]